ncbi:MAG: hypothetical protein CL878_04680 [Dehalococcoidia bacterium]|nr:hypothetical protein [Dehalococcoidia bacterium]
MGNDAPRTSGNGMSGTGVAVEAPPASGLAAPATTHPFLDIPERVPERASQRTIRIAIAVAGLSLVPFLLFWEANAPMAPALRVDPVVWVAFLGVIVAGMIWAERDSLGRHRYRAVGALFFALHLGDIRLALVGTLLWAGVRFFRAREETVCIRLGSGGALMAGMAAAATVRLLWPAEPLTADLSQPIWHQLHWRTLEAVVVGLVYATVVSALGLLDRWIEGDDHLARRLLAWMRAEWTRMVSLSMQALVLLVICERFAGVLTGLLLVAGVFAGIIAYYYVSGRRRDTYRQLLGALAGLVDAKDPYTARHSEAVAVYAAAVADRLAFSRDTTANLVFAAQLHDVGKIGVPDDVLGFPGRLSEAQFDQVREHPDIGGRTIAAVAGLEQIAPIVRAHHERLDGRGYPDRLAEEAIPAPARVLSVADAYDALTSTRAYRPAMPPQQALAILREGAGKQWCGRAVEALAEVVNGERVWSGLRPASIDAFA